MSVLRDFVPPSSANERFLDGHAFLSGLGITIDSESEGEIVVSLPYDRDLVNPGRESMQGGVVATLIDHAGGAALRTVLADPDPPMHATTDLNVSYLRPATTDLTATGRVIRAGRTMGVVQVTVTNTEGSEVAIGRVTLYIDREG